KILRHDLVFGRVKENPGTAGAALTSRAGLRIADVPNDVVIDLICLAVHLHVDGSTDSEHIGEDIGGNAAVPVVAIQPERVGMPNVTNDIAAKEEVARTMELDARSFPGALGVLPAYPLDQIVLDEG